jgi:TolB-like protein/Tfp pilus assembly protein PilF
MPFSWQHLKERKVVQWLLAYAAGAVLLVGVASDLAQGFAAAVIVLRVLVAVLAVGFVGVVVVAWYHGERGQQRVTVAEAGLLGGLVVVAAAAAWIAARSTPNESASLTPAERSVTVRSIAVLPFENIGPAENAYFAAGMTDEIVSRLGAVDGLSVVSSRATDRYAQSAKTMRDIGRELAVDYVIAGSVRSGSTLSASTAVRVTIELLRARNERQLWAANYDRIANDIFQVQSDIAASLVERLGVTMDDPERRRLSARPAENHEAYTRYLKGRYFWNKRTEANIQLGLDYFQQAVDLDPSYSLAWAGIADVWIFRGFYSRMAPRESFPKAKHAALRALEFDSTLAEAHASMAHIHFEFDHDWQAAEREYRRAIELKPAYAVAHHWYGGFLSAMRRHDEALQHARTARELDPLSPIIQTWVGLRFYFNRRYADAIAEYQKALELDQDFAPAHWHLGWAYEQTGRFQEGIAEAERALADDPDNLLYLASLGHAYARAGMKQDAGATLARLTQASSSRHVSAYHVAVIYIALGDADSGLDWLERAYDEQSPWIGYMSVDPRLDPVRTQPRFLQLLRKARLPS